MRAILQIAILCITVLTENAYGEDKATNTVSVSPGSPVIQSNTIQKFIEVLGKYELEDQRSLKRVYLSNRSITCNDGSQAGFYLRKSQGSKRWVIFLEGGWYCYDSRSCRNRWLRLRHLMTSTQWPETRDVGGILSSRPEENPFWWNANHVFVPYCTSDSWSGTRSTPSDMFSFMGAEIVAQVVRDLIPLGLENASSLLFAGSSAGATGVMLNLDHVQSLVHQELNLKHIAIRGVSDSGWFMDRAPYSSNGLPATDAVRKGMELWKARMPHNCVSKYPHEPWRCYFGYRLYPTLSVPLFVFQWLFDEAQMTADNVGAPVTKQQWDYIHKMGDSLRQTFENVTAVFAPSCISHGVLTKKDWQLVKIDEISLPQALHCWEQTTVGNKRNEKLLRSGTAKANVSASTVDGMKTRNGTSSSLESRKTDVDDPGAHLATNGERKGSNNPSQGGRGNKKRRRRKHKGRRRERNKEGKQKKDKHERKKGGRKHGGKHGGNNHTAMLNGTRPQRSVIPTNKRKCIQGCQFRLIERCTWPQCNHSCPRLHNPFTGEEMDFIELLKSFGLDMKSVANALGIDIQTLNNMDHDELLNLLTQQSPN
ncbi:palmitoleoyl-protein carboxylesterase NOTUM isoform X2 [Athalia rosae]|uniref:palmitoleoyl-protein carboxylesterase NOTUM isoform X2 n=1 Tax=Athalia rosae TaxID=37344 RepID=UPI0020337693|nr:palmitoleoyl-protein carboxylesterase NOTUM isoform X2 [Athalia rosae]